MACLTSAVLILAPARVPRIGRLFGKNRYSNPAMFTDVTSGSNPYEKCEGFYAAEGWDPVTGLGTPM